MKRPTLQERIREGIRMHMEMRGHSLRSYCAGHGLDLATLSRFLRGGSASGATLDQYAEALHAGRIAW